MYNTMNNPSAHPSYSHYYLLSPSTLFFVFFFCTSYCFFAHLVVFLHISLSFAHLIVFCTSYCFLHILLFCTFLFHCTFYSYFSFSYHMYALVLCYLYNLYSYCFALSTERTWFDCISLLVMPCITIMWQIKKPWTLTLKLNARKKETPSKHQILTEGMSVSPINIPKISVKVTGCAVAFLLHRACT